MNTLRVQCETCQATLKVRDPGFVGEVHACPRCGSMVLIAAPSPAGEAPAETAPPAAEAAVATLSMGSTLETIEAPPVASAEPVAPPPEADPIEPLETSDPEPLAEPSSLANWAPMAITAASLVATAGIAIAWLASGSPAEPVAAVTEPAPAVTPSEPIEPPTDQVTPKPAPEPEPTAPPIVEPLAQPLPPEEPSPLEPAPAEQPKAFDRVALAAEPPPEIDPLALDLNDVAYASFDDQLPTEPEVKPTEPVEPPAPTLDQRLADAARHAGVYVRRGATNAETVPFAGSSEEALAQKLPAAELRGVPLDVACRLLGDLAGAPITLPPDALRRAGVRADKPVDVLGEDQTLGALLASALKPARLEYAANGSDITIHRIDGDRARTITHRVADLVDGDPAALAERLRQATPAGVPIDVSPTGDLPLTAPMRTHYDLLVACERLRLERGLPTESKYPRALLAESPADQLAPVLDRRTTFSFVEPTPLTTVIAHWRRVTDTPILVDWEALAEHGYGPRTTIVCSATNRPWRVALEGVLEPLGLTWTPAFGGAIWITVP